MVKINVDTRQPLSAQQKTNYINSRPQSVSWYNQLKNEIKTLPKKSVEPKMCRDPGCDK